MEQQEFGRNYSLRYSRVFTSIAITNTFTIIVLPVNSCLIRSLQLVQLTTAIQVLRVAKSCPEIN